LLSQRHNYTVLGGGKTFHPGHPPNFDYPRSWSDWKPESAGSFSANYYGYEYWLDQKRTGAPYSGPCPGHAKALNNSDGLAGPIAVW
jgi:hypothetical protein